MCPRKSRCNVDSLMQLSQPCHVTVPHKPSSRHTPPHILVPLATPSHHIRHRMPLLHKLYNEKKQTMTPKVCRGFGTNHHSAIVKAAKLAGITKTEDVVAFSLGYQDALMQQETESSKAASAAKSPTSSTSFRISETDSPVIAQMQDILKNAKGCLSLAQGPQRVKYRHTHEKKITTVVNMYLYTNATHRPRLIL